MVAWTKANRPDIQEEIDMTRMLPWPVPQQLQESPGRPSRVDLRQQSSEEEGLEVSEPCARL
jgi:hypothetical protein